MASIKFLVILSYAILGLAEDIKVNRTNIDKILHRITTVLDSNRTIDNRDIQLLNRTAIKLGVNSDVITRISNIVNEKSNHTETSTVKQHTYENYGPIEESPAYASSVVLASDLLSLTRAVANVEDKVCREQGYKFLDGLLMNKRPALRSKCLFKYLKVF